MGWLVFLGFFGVAVAVSVLVQNRRDLTRLEFISGYEFPPQLVADFRHEHPEIDGADVPRVFQALRQWLTVARRSDGKPFAMPSRAADDAWHLFILRTREYHDFCDEAYGHYLDHTPNAVAGGVDPEAMPRTLAALDELGARSFDDMPLLFAVDRLVGCERARVWDRESVAAGARAECSTGELPEKDSGGSCCA